MCLLLEQQVEMRSLQRKDRDGQAVGRRWSRLRKGEGSAGRGRKHGRGKEAWEGGERVRGGGEWAEERIGGGKRSESGTKVYNSGNPVDISANGLNRAASTALAWRATDVQSIDTDQ